MPSLVSTGEFHESVPLSGDHESVHTSSLCLFAARSEMGGWHIVDSWVVVRERVGAFKKGAQDSAEQSWKSKLAAAQEGQFFNAIHGLPGLPAAWGDLNWPVFVVQENEIIWTNNSLLRFLGLGGG
jgi:hypothetical protein